jgi:hypothetical protein
VTVAVAQEDMELDIGTKKPGEGMQVAVVIAVQIVKQAQLICSNRHVHCDSEGLRQPLHCVDHHAGLNTCEYRGIKFNNSKTSK